MVWSKIVWFQIMNLMVWAGSGVGKSVQRSLGLGLVLSECTCGVCKTIVFNNDFCSCSGACSHSHSLSQSHQL